MTRRLKIVASVGLAFTLAGGACSSDTDTAAPSAPAVSAAVAASVPGEADGTKQDAAVVRSSSETGAARPADLAGIEQLWLDSGTDPDLASCYRSVLSDAGIAEVVDLTELAQVMGDLDRTGKQALADCLG